jgi:Tfp pilus assembly protein PilO
MKHFSKDKRDRLIIVGVLTIIAAVGVYYLLVRSQQTKAEALAKKIAEQRAKVSGAERLVATKAELKNNLDLASRKLASIEEGMASGDMYAWVIQTVGRFGAERKVEIPQFSREVTADVSMFPKFPYKAAIFNVRGTAYYHDLGQFLSDFENSFPYARVQNLEIDPAGSSAATGTSGAAPTDSEKLSFRLEIVTLINPNAH